MPQRSKVDTLPADAKAWLDRELINRSFAGYEELEALLREKGFRISKSSIHRYGEKLEQRTAAIKSSTEAAKAIAAEVQDDEGAMGQALVALVQDKMFSVLMAVEEADEISPKVLGQLSNAISRLSRANIAQKKYATDVKQRATAAAEAAEKIATKGGLSKDSVQLIRKEILGIPDG